jgi:hypothetical protein
MISSGFFEILGVNSLMGRTFTADEDRRGATPTATITEGLWQRKFGGRKDIIDQRMVLDDVGRTIIGVVPSSFHLRIQNFQRGWRKSIFPARIPYGTNSGLEVH